MVKGIYKITNKQTGEVYIGQTTDIESRKNRHFKELSQGIHHNSGMQKDHDLGHTFSFEILEELPNATKSDLYNKESHYIKEYNSFREGYNQTPAELWINLKVNMNMVVEDYRLKNIKEHMYLKHLQFLMKIHLVN